MLCDMERKERLAAMWARRCLAPTPPVSEDETEGVRLAGDIEEGFGHIAGASGWTAQGSPPKCPRPSIVIPSAT